MRFHIDKKGAWQTGQVGVPLQPLQVCIQDDEGIPVHKLEVRFRLVQGKGRFTHRDAETDSAGCAVAEFVPEGAGLYRVDCLVGGRGGRQTQFTGSAVEAAPAETAPAETVPAETAAAPADVSATAETPAAEATSPEPTEPPAQATEPAPAEPDSTLSGTLPPEQGSPAEGALPEEPSIIVDPSLLASEPAENTDDTDATGTQMVETAVSEPEAQPAAEGQVVETATVPETDPVQAAPADPPAATPAETAPVQAKDDVPSLQELVAQAQADTADKPPAEEEVDVGAAALVAPAKGEGGLSRRGKIIRLVILTLGAVAILLVGLMFLTDTKKPSATAVIPGSIDCSGVAPKAVGQTYVFEGCRKVP